MSAIGDRAPNGFTLIEALVVVAITALLAGLVFPRIQSAVRGQAFRAATTGLTLALKETRAAAIRSGLPTRFTLADGGHAYAVNGAERPALADPFVVTAPEAQSIGFFPDGTSTGGRLILSGGTAPATFTVFPTTGLVVVSGP